MTEPTNRSEVAAAYDEWAESYDTDANRTRELAARILRQTDLQLANRNVVEIGCGTGYNTAWLADGGGSVIAMDFSPGMLRQAKARVSNTRVRFLQHDVRSPWPLADTSADLVIAMLILEHVERLEPIFAEAARTLATGGGLFICELHPRRQLMGKQAEFTSAKTGEHRRVEAFLHQTEDYANAGLSCGFELVSAVDWFDAYAQPEDPPRLLSLSFLVPAS